MWTIDLALEVSVQLCNHAMEAEYLSGNEAVQKARLFNNAKPDTAVGDMSVNSSSHNVMTASWLLQRTALCFP